MGESEAYSSVMFFYSENVKAIMAEYCNHRAKSHQHEQPTRVYS